MFKGALGLHLGPGPASHLLMARAARGPGSGTSAPSRGRGASRSPECRSQAPRAPVEEGQASQPAWFTPGPSHFRFPLSPHDNILNESLCWQARAPWGFLPRRGSHAQHTQPLDRLLRLCVVLVVKHKLRPTHMLSEASLPPGRISPDS